MRKTFELEDLDCANCAAKMEEAIKKLPGVKRVSVNFMTQKMILDAEDSQFSYVKEDDKKAKKAVLQDCGSLCAVDCRSHSSDSRAL